MASKKDGVLYIGMTNNLARRVFEHKNNLIKGFTEKYFVHKIVYLEEFDDVHQAIQREKCLKKWNRVWKVRLIEKQNPDWKDLSNELL
jgi:putative endonuclease